MNDSSHPFDIEIPPFPRLRWTEHDWVGTTTLSAWAGFQSRGGAYGSRDSAEPSDGRAQLYVKTPDDSSREQPTIAQRKAYEFLLAHQERIRDAILSALLRAYDAWRSDWAEAMDEEEFAELMPPVSNLETFRSLIGLSNIHVHTVEKEGLAYIGLELECTWDEEHGLGCMIHGDRVVEVGDADTSFLEWIAERDAKADDESKLGTTSS